MRGSISMTWIGARIVKSFLATPRSVLSIDEQTYAATQGLSAGMVTYGLAGINLS